MLAKDLSTWMWIPQWENWKPDRQTVRQALPSSRQGEHRTCDSRENGGREVHVGGADFQEGEMEGWGWAAAGDGPLFAACAGQEEWESQERGSDPQGRGGGRRGFPRESLI